VSNRLAKITRAMSEVDRLIVVAASEAIVDALEAQLSADAGGDRALSGIGGGRYPLKTQQTPLTSPAGVRIRPAAKQSGMWTLLDSGRSGFDVKAKPRRKRKPGTRKGTSRAGAMNVGGAWRTGPWHVGGTAGKRTWSRGIDKGRPAAIAAARDALRRSVLGG
jgi:hypothetical protein